MNERRPFWAITKEELDYFMKKHRRFREAWASGAAFMRMRDRRGVKRWLFALGWIACAHYYEDLIAEMEARFSERMALEARRQAEDVRKKMGVPH